VIDKVIVRRSTYHDSITLMRAARAAEDDDGVAVVGAVMATPTNVGLLREQGFEFDADVGPDDLVIAVRAVDEGAGERAVRRVESELEFGGTERHEPARAARVRSFRSAARAHPEVNVAFVSVPGRYAAYEVASAIEAGLNVFCFSDGMSLSDEAALKRRALERGLLLLGADCGTAVVDGVGLGFTNVLESGPVGVVGASGTGIQQLTCLLDAAGVGISHAVGVGGRDLHAEVGGAMTLRALELLADDAATEVIAVVSKPPDADVAGRVVDAAARAGKPVVVGLLGARRSAPAPRGVEVTASLEGTAARVARLCGRALELRDAEPPARRTPGRIHGLFCGGSLLHEAAGVLAPGAADAVLVDYGDDEFTQGRAHPIIDPRLRNERFGRAARDPEVGAVLVDVVLGRGAHPDPGGELAAHVRAALGDRPGAVTIVVTLCGTGRDPQRLADQERALRTAGAVVTRNAAHAARVALAATGRGVA
jgi:FdrA protein